MRRHFWRHRTERRKRREEPSGAGFCPRLPRGAVRVAVDFGPRMGSVVITRRGATPERFAHPSVQPLLRDAKRGSALPPWVETHGYRHFVAPRRPRTPQTHRKWPNSRARAFVRAVFSQLTPGRIKSVSPLRTRGDSFFSIRTFSSTTNFGSPPSSGRHNSPSMSGCAYSTNFSFGRKPSSLIQSRGMKCSTLAMSPSGCKSTVHL